MMDQMPIRRVAKVLAGLELRGGEAIKICVARKLDRLRLRRKRLHHHNPRAIAPTRPTRHLHQQLKRALMRAEIRHVHR